MLNDDELRGVIAHELSHVKNRDVLISTIAAIMAGAISWLTYMALLGRRRRPTRQSADRASDDDPGPDCGPDHPNGDQPLAGVSRRTVSGAELAGRPRGLARSLQKLEAANQRIPLPVPDAQSSLFIVQPLTGSSIAKLFSTHPPTEERVARLLAMERRY